MRYRYGGDSRASGDHAGLRSGDPRLAVAPEQEGFVASNARSRAELLVEEARKDGAREMKLSFVPGEHSPHGFYAGFGFEDTGEVHGGESVMRSSLE